MNTDITLKNFKTERKSKVRFTLTVINETFEVQLATNGCYYAFKSKMKKRPLVKISPVNNGWKAEGYFTDYTFVGNTPEHAVQLLFGF